MTGEDRTLDIARRSFLLGLGLVGLAPAAHAALEVVIAGTVTSVIGQSTGTLRGEKRQLAIGANVFLDDTLGTGSGARLGVRLGTTTTLSLGERTRVRIDKFLVDRGGKLVLERGAMLFDRPSDQPSGEMNVSTPFGLIAARGTRFFAGRTSGVFSVFVDHGEVEVRNVGGAVRLTDGLGTNLRSARTGPTEPVRWSRGRIEEALALVG